MKASEELTANPGVGKARHFMPAIRIPSVSVTWSGTGSGAQAVGSPRRPCPKEIHIRGAFSEPMTDANRRSFLTTVPKDVQNADFSWTVRMSAGQTKSDVQHPTRGDFASAVYGCPHSERYRLKEHVERIGGGMTMVQTSAEPEYVPPGPGSWTIDTVHFPRPVTRYFSDTHPEPFARGFHEYCAYYGSLLGDIEIAYVNGLSYGRRSPVAPEEVPQRLARAEEVWREKAWRRQLAEWDEEFKPASIRKHRELQAIDPDLMSDSELSAYLERCRDNHAEMIYQHMRFTGAAMIALGDLLAHAKDWTDRPLSELIGMMRGAAPVSAGSSEEMQRMLAAIRATPAARELLERDDQPDAPRRLEALCTSGGVGAAVRDYVDLIGCRLLDGFDIGGRYALELPDALLRAIRALVEDERGADALPEVAAQTAAIRDEVPDDHRAQFDELLGEARLMYRLRDERGVYSDIWAAGLMRRAAMAAGRRLSRAGRIEDPEHIVDASLLEMQALLAGASEPASAELAQRYDWRTTHDAKAAPKVLGDAPAPRPDRRDLPPAASRVMRAMALTAGQIHTQSREEHGERVIRGLPASGGVYEGPVCRVAGPADFDRIARGDVLLTETTSEAFNILLPLLGAIVTDAGGLLSHPAIVAREYGIPGVVGTRDATAHIPDGGRVRVDGAAGVVTILG
jgi:pyruvate,water dikinase